MGQSGFWCKCEKTLVCCKFCIIVIHRAFRMLISSVNWWGGLQWGAIALHNFTSQMEFIHRSIPHLQQIGAYPLGPERNWGSPTHLKAVLIGIKEQFRAHFPTGSFPLQPKENRRPVAAYFLVISCWRMVHYQLTMPPTLTDTLPRPTLPALMRNSALSLTRKPKVAATAVSPL